MKLEESKVKMSETTSRKSKGDTQPSLSLSHTEKIAYFHIQRELKRPNSIEVNSFHVKAEALTDAIVSLSHYKTSPQPIKTDCCFLSVVIIRKTD